MSLDEKIQIKMEDKYFNESALQKIIKHLKLPSDIVTDNSADEIQMSLIKFLFDEYMNFFLKMHKFPITPANITLESFDQTIAYEIDFLKLLE
jgi:hypothetical protein